MRLRASLAAGAAGAAMLTALAPALSAQAATGFGDGTLSGLFAEGGMTDPTTACHPGTDPQSGRAQTICTPAAASVMVLPSGKVLYWDALEGMEDVKYNVVAEYGNAAQNDQARVMDLATGRWSTPTPYDGGANPTGNDNSYAPGTTHDNTNTRNDGDLFCSDQVFLADGRVLDAGGTSYYLEPAGVQDPTSPGTSYGATELEGLKNTRIYNPATNAFTQSGKMAFGRWYPGLVTLPDGKVFVASGVTKLIKPVYADRPQDSGTNVEETETFDPAANGGAGAWKTNGTGGLPTPAADPASHSLPLFPRLHLLPDGKVYYDGGGQTFNPSGQSYDEALWNQTAAYDPKTQTWATLSGPTMGVPVSGPTPALAAPTGFRGSTFSQMLSLKPDATGTYTKASFLSAGGVLGVSPGSYVGSTTSTINTVSTAGDMMTSEATAPLAAPRWYANAVTLPTGAVVVVNGADRDEVVNPGSGTPVKTIETFDPDTKTWSTGLSQLHGRTYHNSAVLLPDGSVLIGGHAPIGTGYAFGTDAGVPAGLSSYRRDPSFQVYKPGYFGQARPQILLAPTQIPLDSTQNVVVDDAAAITKVVLVRNTAQTHLVDGDQRTVELPFTRDGNSLKVRITDNAAALPSGPYMLFAIRGGAVKDQVPSVSQQVSVVPAGTRSITVQPGPKAPTTTPVSATTTATSPKAPAKRATTPVVRAQTTSRVAPVQPARTLAFTGDTRGTALALLPALLLGVGVGARRYVLRQH